MKADDLIKSYENLGNGLQDLSNLMCSDDPGASYVTRLFEESKLFYIQILTFMHENKHIDLDLEVKTDKKSSLAVVEDSGEKLA